MGSSAGTRCRTDRAPCAGNGEPGAAVSEPVAADGEAVDQRGADAGADEPGSVAVEQHVTGLEPSGRGTVEPARGVSWPPVEREAGVVAAAGAGVGDIDEPVVDGDADRVLPPEETGLPAGLSHRPSDAQHRDLVAAGVDREQVAAVAAQLQRPLRGNRGPIAPPVPAPPTANGDPGIGVSVPSGMAVEAGDRVSGRTGRVVVDVDVPDDTERCRCTTSPQSRDHRGERNQDSKTKPPHSPTSRDRRD